ncbi:MAG: Mth938-like domain-containing protein [Burkholderiaceae bacterium]|mgnify:CR=1 FL=1|jgi:uncharacterized protein|nr:Mth938-like domain-containing protein [Burkholderiaceae bacterium]
MKLQPDRFDAPAINAYGPGWLAVNGQRYASSLIVNANGRIEPWPWHQFGSLCAESFTALSAQDAEIVLFGSGLRLRFPQPVWLQALVARRIGVETMDSPAACRTYNILASEGRRVVAAILLETDGNPSEKG